MSNNDLSGTTLLDATQLRRAVALTLIYTAIVGVSFYLAYEIRFDFLVPIEQQQERLRLLPAVLAIKLVALIACRQLGSLMTYFSVPDLMRLFWAMLASSAVIMIPRLSGWPLYSAPRGVLLTDFMLCFGGLCVGRLTARIYRERLSGARRVAHGGVQLQMQRIAIIGAGDAGASLAKEFLSAPWLGFQPVMFFDDDTTKHGKFVHNVPVVGRAESIAEVKGADSLAKAVIAMPSAPARRVRDIVAAFSAHGIKVETLPSLEELASGRVKATRIRPVEVQDLLGRDSVDLDSAGIRAMLEDKVVMVTGAGGSIGSELCRQIAGLNPQRLLLVEQSEAALFLIEQEMNELGFSGTIVPLVADILDRPRMDHLLGWYQPQVVFHAAAHKHVYLMERQPAEAIRNNAIGTRQLAELAKAHRVESFVFISTDKAINPTNVMGATKRLAELQLMAVAAGQGADVRSQRSEVSVGSPTVGAALRRDETHPQTTDQRSEVRGQTSEKSGDLVVAGLAKPAEPIRVKQSAVSAIPPTSDLRPLASDLRLPTKFMAVRFGNVLGSSGSVIPIFKRQIAKGGPVTVTHPEVTRYFMTIPEAVGLVLQSFVLGKGGEIFVLDMGQPVKIVDLAKQMIELSGFRVGEDIEIVFSGLKPGEKLFEELQHHTEEYAPTAHPRIMQFRGQAAFDPAVLRDLESRLHTLDSNELKEVLRSIVPEYTPFRD